MRQNRFIERSIMRAVSFLKESLFADEYAGRAGFLQARDPRTKALGIIILLLAVLFSQSIAFICGIYVLCLFLALASSLHLLFYLKRTWFFVPLFTAFIAFPAMVNIVTPGQPLLNLFGLANVSITRQGVASAALFFARVLTSVSLAVLLTLTTRHVVLLKVLRFYKVPLMFVMTMGMCYRYIYLLLDIIQMTYRAIKSRVGYITSSGKARRVVAWNIAGLWQRSYQMHELVYLAMVSRGYTGEPRVLERFHCTRKDLVWLAFAGIVCAGSIWQTYFLG